jgi:hypothetical protein
VIFSVLTSARESEAVALAAVWGRGRGEVPAIATQPHKMLRNTQAKVDFRATFPSVLCPTRRRENCATQHTLAGRNPLRLLNWYLLDRT